MSSPVHSTLNARESTAERAGNSPGPGRSKFGVIAALSP